MATDDTNDQATQEKTQEKPKVPTIFLDADPWNRDWPKRTWDPALPDTVEELRAFLEAIGMTVDEFKEFPVYVWNVDKPELAWLKDL